MQAKFDRVSRIRCIPSEDKLNKITKYEMALENSIFKNLAALKTLQKNRKKLPAGKVENFD